MRKRGTNAHQLLDMKKILDGVGGCAIRIGEPHKKKRRMGGKKMRKENKTHPHTKSNGWVVNQGHGLVLFKKVGGILREWEYTPNANGSLREKK